MTGPKGQQTQYSGMCTHMYIHNTLNYYNFFKARFARKYIVDHFINEASEGSPMLPYQEIPSFKGISQREAPSKGLPFQEEQDLSQSFPSRREHAFSMLP